MLEGMRRSNGPGPDLFEDFAHRVEDEAEETGRMPGAGTIARSAGVTVALMVLTSLGAIGGAWFAAGHTPDVEYTSVLWEGVVVLLWSGLWGLLAGAAALAVGLVVVALPWVRRQRSGD